VQTLEPKKNLPAATSQEHELDNDQVRTATIPDPYSVQLEELNQLSTPDTTQFLDAAYDASADLQTLVTQAKLALNESIPLSPDAQMASEALEELADAIKYAEQGDVSSCYQALTMARWSIQNAKDLQEQNNPNGTNLAEVFSPTLQQLTTITEIPQLDLTSPLIQQGWIDVLRVEVSSAAQQLRSLAHKEQDSWELFSFSAPRE
jgi:hypothetical protein